MLSTASPDKLKILFVCLGNICRSPMAEGILGHMIEQQGLQDYLEVDSAGTGDWHVGELPYTLTRSICQERGITLTHRARVVKPIDHKRFDYLVLMDDMNRRNLPREGGPGPSRAKLVKMRDYDPEKPGSDVPDPYHGDEREFRMTYEILERSLQHFLDFLKREHPEVFQADKTNNKPSKD